MKREFIENSLNLEVMKKIIYCIAAGMFAISCSKDNDSTSQNKPGETNFGKLTIAETFNWSSSTKGSATVILDAPENFVTNNQSIYIIDEKGNRLSHEKVNGNQATFPITLPQTGEKYYILLPATGDKMELTSGNHTLKVNADFENDVEGMLQNLDEFKGKKSTQKTAFTGQEMLVNGDFSTNNFSYYNPATITGKWMHLNANFEWKTVNGNKVGASKSYAQTQMIQGWNCTPGDSFTFSTDVYSSSSYRAAATIMWLTSSHKLLRTQGYFAANGMSTMTFSGVVPANAATGVVMLFASYGSWFDNVSLLEGPAITDSDNDGVEDANDEFPTDPARAYTSRFPTSGYQTLAFEDLWPAQGDYDFNDMVISSQILYTLDANNNKVDATVTISLDAMGAGASNGLALRLLNMNNQPIGSNVIASITGDATADPDNENGIIVFDDAKTAQSEYYTNNGNGPSKQPDEFTFTITFNSNAGSQGIISDIYIYRTGERGREIHLDGFTGSSAADASLYNTKMDHNGTYNTENGLPWVIEVVSNAKSFKHPNEKVDILQAYPQFQQWAESNGSSFQTWFLNPNLPNVFKLL